LGISEIKVSFIFNDTNIAVLAMSSDDIEKYKSLWHWQ